jgi:predicted acetyltransferase
MDVRLAPIARADRAELVAPLEPYLIAHADAVDPQRLHGDPTDYPRLDLYWTEPERRPLWILADGARAGFALVNAWSPSGLGTDHAIAEFCVVPGRRRAGVGRAAAQQVFRSAPGWWELQVFRATPPAMAFWPGVIAATSPATWEQIDCKDRVIHRFRL